MTLISHCKIVDGPSSQEPSRQLASQEVKMATSINEAQGVIIGPLSNHITAKGQISPVHQGASGLAANAHGPAGGGKNKQNRGPPVVGR